MTNHSAHEHIGAKVSVPGTPGQAILRYVGEIEGKTGTFGGLELLGTLAALKGKNNGDVDGVLYFEVVELGLGLFLPIDRLTLLNPQLLRPPSRRSSSTLSTSSSPASHKEISPKGLIRMGIPRTALRVMSSSSNNSRPGSRMGSSLNGISEKSPSRSGLGYPTISDTEARLQAMTASKNCLEKELETLRSDHKRSCTEADEKLAILNELQHTVETLQPLLENYEKELSEKDNKLLKQRKDFEMAREEWRESLDVLVNTHQEAEDFYESEIEKLSEMVAKLRLKTTSQNGETLKEMESLQIDKSLLEKELNARIIELEADLQRAEKSESELRDRNGIMAKTQYDLNHELTTIKQRLEDLNLEVEKQADLDALEKKSLTAEKQKLISDNETLKQQNILLETELAEWKKQHDAKYVSLQNEFANFQKESELKLAAALEELERTVELLHQKKDELQFRLHEKENELSQIHGDSTTKIKIIEDSLNNDKVKVQTLLDTTTKKLQELQTSYDSHLAENEQLKKELKEREQVEIQLNTSIDSLQTENQKLNTTIEELKSGEFNHQKSFDQQRKELEEIHSNTLKQLQQEHQAVHKDLLASHNNLKEEFKLLDNKHQTLIKEFASAKEKHISVEDKIKGHENTISSHQSENESLLLKLEESTQTIKKLDAWKVTSQSQFKEFENTIRSKDQYISELQEQVKRKKSVGDSDDIKKLKDEIENLKNELHENSNLESMIEQLKKDFESRPTFDELTELQNKIKEIETLHKWETDQLSKELKEVNDAKSEIEKQLQATATELKALKEEVAAYHRDNTVSTVDSTANISLPAYIPKVAIDPSSGKTNWCGLCEREGHDSVHCPYENDLF